MDGKKFILRANGSLYNKYSPRYKNPEQRRNIWRQIAEEIEYPETVCQRRWSCLRDRYVKEKQQETSSSSSEASYTCQRPFIRAMEYTPPRPMRRSDSIFRENLESPLSRLSPVCEPSSMSLFESISEIPTTSAKAKRKRTIKNDDDKYSAEAIKTYQKFSESEMEKPQEDALTGFGNMIVATIRTMSETNQLLAMQKVTSLVMVLKLND